MAVDGGAGTDAVQTGWHGWEDSEAFFDYGGKVGEFLGGVAVDFGGGGEGGSDFLGEVVEG